MFCKSSVTHRTTFATHVGNWLTVVSFVITVISLVRSVISGDGWGALAALVALVGLIGLLITVGKHHDSVKMCEFPAAFMSLFIASNLILVISEHWSYVFMLLPLVAMILLITATKNEPVFGIVAGILMIILNLIIGIVIFRKVVNDPVSQTNMFLGPTLRELFFSNPRRGISSFYLAGLLLRTDSLMGLACILFFHDFPEDWVSIKGGSEEHNGTKQQENVPRGFF